MRSRALLSKTSAIAASQVDESPRGCHLLVDPGNLDLGSKSGKRGVRRIHMEYVVPGYEVKRSHTDYTDNCRK